MKITDEVVTAFLKCRYKAYLKLTGHSGERSDYERTQTRLESEYRVATQRNLLERQRGEVIETPPSLPEVIRSGTDLIIGASASDGDECCRIDALERGRRIKTTPSAAFSPYCLFSAIR